jgi:DNA sulfur modification protein DndC
MTDLSLLEQVAREVDPDASHELYKLTRNLLALQFQTIESHKRAKHLDRLEEVLHHHAFRNESEALEFALSDHSLQHEVAGEDADESDSTELIA